MINKKELLALGTVDEASQMKATTVYGLANKNLNPVLLKISRFLSGGILFTRAKGLEVWDDSGNVYDDFLAGFGTLNLGHEPDDVLHALDVVKDRPNILQIYPNPYASKLSEYLALLCPGKLARSFFCSTGTEAVEAALKLARKVASKKNIVSAIGSYHGKTFGALSVSGKAKYKSPFEPLLPNTLQIPFGDIKQLELTISKNEVGIVILEPIQGENGVIVPPKGYLRSVRAVCDKYGVILLLDEVQTGMGRTGKMFACEHEQVVPDIMILSKSLGGGIMPIGAIVTTDELWQKAYGEMESGLLHTSTFGGNTRACACAIEAIRKLVHDDLANHAEEVGSYFKAKLEALAKETRIIKEVRGQGLMLALSLVKIKSKSKALEGGLSLWLCRRLLKRHKIIVAFTLNNPDVLRISPPLIVTKEKIDHFVACLQAEIKQLGLLNTFKLVE